MTVEMKSIQNQKSDPRVFATELFEKMKRIDPAIANLELYEFCYGLDNYRPEAGWQSVIVDSQEKVESMLDKRDFFMGIQLKPRIGEKIVLDEQIVALIRMVFKGLAEGRYPSEWVIRLFFFDIRGFIFMPRTKYFTNQILSHFGGKPFRVFEPRQKHLLKEWQIGYREFKESNAEIDSAFIESMLGIAEKKGTPLLISLAGPTAAGKTEIIARLREAFIQAGKKITTLEMDNFLIDRDSREKKPMGRDTVHFDLFIQSLEGVLAGKKVSIPRYDFVKATSSHDLNGKLRKGSTPIEVAPSDIIFLEGNFPFHMEELAGLISIKVVYLTDDPIRLKRKWKRDVDYRKKYDPAYFMNRFFQTQFMRAEDCYRPLMEVCDMVVDTTQAVLWVAPGLQEALI